MQTHSGDQQNCTPEDLYNLKYLINIHANTRHCQQKHQLQLGKFLDNLQRPCEAVGTEVTQTSKI